MNLTSVFLCGTPRLSGEQGTGRQVLCSSREVSDWVSASLLEEVGHEAELTVLEDAEEPLRRVAGDLFPQIMMNSLP